MRCLAPGFEFVLSAGLAGSRGRIRGLGEGLLLGALLGQFPQPLYPFPQTRNPCFAKPLRADLALLGFALKALFRQSHPGPDAAADLVDELTIVAEAPLGDARHSEPVVIRQAKFPEGEPAAPVGVISD